jgi:hypothetical protein
MKTPSKKAHLKCHLKYVILLLLGHEANFKKSPPKMSFNVPNPPVTAALSPLLKESLPNLSFQEMNPVIGA